MNDAALVRLFDRIGHLSHQRRRLAGRHGTFRQLAGQVASLDKLHRKVRFAIDLAHIVQINDIGMAQPGHSFGFPQESLQFVRAGVLAR